MNTTFKTFFAATFAIALIGTSLSATIAEAGPRGFGGTKSVSSMDLGSSR